MEDGLNASRDLSPPTNAHRADGGGRHPAIENLRGNQGQMDADGIIVSVSRQALDETLAITEELLTALGVLLDGVDDEISPDDGVDGVVMLPLFESEIRKARAAIAKALGTSTASPSSPNVTDPGKTTESNPQ